MSTKAWSQLSPADQKLGQFGVAGDVPDLQHRQPCGDVLVGHRERLGHGTDTVVQANVGVPQRVPQQLGDLGDHVGGHVVMHQHEVEVGVGHELPAAQAAGCDDGESAGGRDTDLGGLGGQPEFMQIQKGVAQGGRIQLPVTAFQQLLVRGRQIFRGFGRTRRRCLPSGGAGGGIS